MSTIPNMSCTRNRSTDRKTNKGTDRTGATRGNANLPSSTWNKICAHNAIGQDLSAGLLHYSTEVTVVLCQGILTD